MKKSLFILLLVCLGVSAQESLPLRGLAIAAPSTENVDRFVSFIDKELSPLNINTLILRVDYNFQYQSHPELAEDDPLTQADVDKIVAICTKNGISIVPQINL